MALHASNKVENIKASVEKYLKDNLETAESLTVDYQGLPFESGSTAVTEWVQPRLLPFIDPSWKPKASSTTRGNEASVMLNTNIFVKKETTTKTDRHFELRDLVAKHLYSGVSIPLRDYAGGTTRPYIVLMKVHDVTTDAAVPGENFWQWNYTVELKWLRQWTG